jgi:adenylate cyclase
MSEAKRPQERRLGAIMFTDVVGYTSITERDENTSLRILDEHRTLLARIFPKYSGEVVKTMGDAFLVEFASAVEAVNCAVEIQGEMSKFNEGRAKGEAVTIRIGIHVGDVVHSQNDILGDAVNVAARVEPVAEPGGICVTRQVVDQVRGKVQYQIVNLGTRELKNIKNPVELYKVMSSSTFRTESETLDPRRVAVLPLANMSPDPNDKYFAEGLTEELISTISRIGELSVISRTSVTKYRDTVLSIGQIGQELAAGSIIEGSIRKAGNTVRVTAQLIQADNDRHLWSQSYDRDMTDVFAIQADIAERVAEALKIRLLSNEKESVEKRATSSPEAYTLYLKGRYFWNERTESGLKNAVKYFQEAIKVDSNFAMAYSGLADAYLIMSDYGWMDNVEASPLAKRNAMKALEIDDSLAEAHASLGLYYQECWQFDLSQKELERAIELRPNYPAAYHWYAISLSFLKKHEESKKMLERERLLDPFSRVANMSIGVNLYYLRKFEESLEQLDKVIAENLDFAAPHFWKSIVYAEIQRFDQAIEEGKKFLELENGSATAKMNLAHVYALAGNGKSAQRLMDEAQSEKKGFLSPGTLAVVKLALGEDEEGFSLLEKACQTRDTTFLYIRGAPGFEKYQQDPRWLELERKAGLADR